MIKELTPENFETNITNNKRPVVIKAYAVWCGPCVQLTPIFHEIAKDFHAHVDFFELNVDHARDLAIKFGITSIPTLIFMKDGHIISKEIGYIDTDDLRAKVTQFLTAVQS